MAHRAQIPASYLSDLENAKSAPGIDLVDRLAQALGTTVGALLPAEPPPATPDALRDQAKRLLEELLARADRDVIVTVHSLLSLLRELSTRRR